MSTFLARFKIAKPSRNKLIVWMVFLSVLLGGAALADSSWGQGEKTVYQLSAEQAAKLPALPVAAVENKEPLIGSTSTLLTSKTENTAAAETALDAYAAGAMPFAPTEETYQIGQVADIGSLPAWRWNNFTMYVASDTGFANLQGGMNALLSTVASVMFAIANFVWQALLGFLRFGLSADFVTTLAGPINNATATISSHLIPVLGAFLAFVVFFSLKFALKGQLKKAIASMLLFLLSIGGIFAFGNAAQNAGDSLAPGSMPWVVAKTTSALNTSAASLTSGFGISPTSGYDPTYDGNGSQDSLSCSVYINRLYDKYIADNGGASVSNTDSLVVASKLWQTSFLNSWTRAQHGAPTQGWDLGSRVACRQLEAQAGVTEQNQMNVSRLANGGTALPVNESLYGPWPASKDVQAKALTAWAACVWNGGESSEASSWSVTAPFVNDGTYQSVKNGQNPSDPAACAKEMTEGITTSSDSHFHYFYKWRDNMSDEGTLAISHNWNTALWGGQMGDRFLQGALAFVVAVAFLFSLGFVAIGMIVAQFMLVLLLMLFPVTLLLLGIGAGAGPRFLKLTGTTALSTFFFALLLSFITEVIALGQAFISNIGDGGGIFNQLLYGVMPIIALVITKKLLSYANLGNIMKPTGALSFMAASSMAATRDKDLTKFISKEKGEKSKSLIERAVGKNQKASKALNALDNFNAAKIGKKALVDPAKAGAKAGAKATAKGAAAVSKKGREGVTDRLATTRLGRNETTAKYLHLLRQDGFKAAGTSAMGQVGQALRTKAKANAAAIGVGGIGAAGAGMAASVAATGAGVVAAGLPLVAAGAAVGAGAYAISKIKRAKQLKAQAEGFDVQADTYASNYAQADYFMKQQTQALTRSKPAVRLKRENEHVSAVLENTISNHMGSNFQGFDSMGLQVGAMDSYASNLKLQRDQVVVSDQGLALTVPMSKEIARKKLDMKDLANGYHWLDEETKKRRVVLEIDGTQELESDEIYTARIHATMNARGLLTAGGEYINVFEKNGIDVESPEGSARVKAWMDGEADKVLDSLVYKSSGAHEERLVNASARWVQETQIKRINQIAQQEAELMTLVETTLQNRGQLEQEMGSKLESFSTLNAHWPSEVGRLRSAVAVGDENAMNELAAKRKAWTKAGEEAISSVMNAQDALTTIKLDLEAANATDGKVQQYIENAERIQQELNARQQHLETLFAQANGGGDIETSRFSQELIMMENEVKQIAAQIEQAESAAKERIKLTEERAAVDNGRYGQAIKPKRAMQLFKGTTRFPSK